MNSKDRLLTICIPTYNRKDFLENQLIFFQKQIEQNKQILDSVSFIVSNNSSTDGTLLMLNTWDKHLKYFEHYTNELNVGLVGNIKASLDRATTKYVWFVSDDDQLKDGIIEKVLYALSNFNPEYLFLNYFVSKEQIKTGYSEASGYILNAKSKALEIFNESYGSLVFMTSCIYKRANILELNNNIMSTWISSPLLYSFYSCSKGPMYIMGEPLVTFNAGNASYAGIKRVLKIKFEEYIKILERLVEFGYNKNEVCKTIKTFFKKQSHSHFLYNFVNIRKSIKYYKYYNFSTFFFFPVNTIKYLFTRR